jgi:GT2 family glycosyltransferase
MINIATLATCHNRIEFTRSSLTSLYNQIDNQKIFSFTHIIVDDGSTDGTLDMISKEFPEVRVIKGDGNLYWAGGMRLGWENISNTLDFDYLFAYNDDVTFQLDAISSLINALSRISSKVPGKSTVITGDFKDPNSDCLTYGGLVRNSICNPLSFQTDTRGALDPIKVDTVNMNGCLIGADVLNEIGFLASYFVHGGADLEFGLRAAKAEKLMVLRLPKVLGFCERNPPLQLRGSIKDKWAKLRSEKCQPVAQRYIFYKKYGGIFWRWFYIRYYLKAFIL